MLGGGAEKGREEEEEEREKEKEGGKAKTNKNILLVGLGAGGLAAHLAAERRCSVTAVELDPSVVLVARDHFGLAAVEEKLEAGEGKGSLSVVIGDGVVEVEKAAAASKSSTSSPNSSSFSAIVVDAGGGDASLAMSCPPPPFVTDEFAAAAAAALAPTKGGEGKGKGGGAGILAVNCVSRDQKPVADLASTLKRHFSRIFEIDVPEDVNRVLFATGPLSEKKDEAKDSKPESTSASSKPSLLPHGEKAVSKALDAFFGAPSAPIRDPGAAAGGSSVAEMADLIVER